MQYRRLGRTGLDVSVLGFGCMRLPTAGSPDKIDEGAATRLIHDAIDAGVNYIDTAWFYHAAGGGFGNKGESEPFVGRALSGGWRDKVLLATKLPQQIIKTREEVAGFLDLQLERLQTDHVDFYLVHGLDGAAWDRMKDFGVREYLDEAKASGKIRHAAFSFHGAKADFPRIVDDYEGWAFGQIQYNYMDTDYQAGYEGLRYAADKGLGLVVMEPLKGGRLARNLPPEVKAVFEARSEGWSPAEWALRYVWNEAGVSLLLSGMGEASQLEENLRVAEASGPGALSLDQVQVYEAARLALKSRTKADCTGCRYCQPCPEGVAIPELFAAYNAGAIWAAKDSALKTYTRIKGRSGTCSVCGQCEGLCPQGLPIRSLLKETAAYFEG